MSDNTAVLTKGAQIYSKKRKARKEQVEEVSFDPKDRRTFLTGFHKRKVQRRERAVEQAKLREREEKLLLRKERREQQHEALVNKIRENKSIYGIVDSDSDELGNSQSGDESAGAEDGEGSGQEESGDEEEENEEEGGNVETSVLRGEDSITTVRIVRDLDLNALGEDEDMLERRLTPQQLIGRLRKDIVDRSRRAAVEEQEQEEASKKTSKKKTKKFRYETKAKRAAKNSKDRAKSKSATHERRAKKGTGKPGRK
ncbi:hypothetical protein LPJ53_005376 [Coemansia erecta]|uniref:Nucleolar protein 12 n=1 Tax=Coemansia erecta TaxID=147472 RepID=A0A9W7XWZ2_9FUNG|nr:hypothetical protein LPJ53_005376 [Coemansia erecta]